MQRRIVTVRMTRVRQLLRRTVYGWVAAIAVLAMSISSMGVVNADPASDAMARLNELSRQAIKAREAVTAAQRDVDARLAAQSEAEARHRADLEALEAANSQLQPLQAAAGRVVAMAYMGGRTGELQTALTAESPQQLIDQLSIQRLVAAQTTEQIKGYQLTRQRAAEAALASERSAADARAAAEQAAAVQAELKAKWSELLRQIAAAEAQYAALTPQQQAMVDNAAAPPPESAPPADLAAAPGQAPPGDVGPSLAIAGGDIPDALPVGVAPEAGLQPNTILAARAVSARFPQISTIGGVRPDSKPWHPSGLAIDIMIPNPQSPEGIELGNEILAFALSNADRFGLQDVIWRGTYYTPAGPQASGYGHFDHVHITTTPSR
ncbi:glycoside hydrolase [Mycobacterium intermedium]